MSKKSSGTARVSRECQAKTKSGRQGEGECLSSRAKRIDLAGLRHGKAREREKQEACGFAYRSQ